MDRIELGMSDRLCQNEEVSKLASFDYSCSSSGSVLSELSLEKVEERDMIRHVARKLTFDHEGKENAAPTLPVTCEESEWSGESEPVVHVEVAVSRYSSCDRRDIEDEVKLYLQREVKQIEDDVKISDFTACGSDVLRDNVLQVVVADSGASEARPVSLEVVELQLHTYHLHSDGGEEYIESEDGGGGYLAAAATTLLPSCQLDSLWEGLIYDDDVKRRLLSFATTSLYFSECGVDSNIIACNRLILLHGPPGTGKTSLCRALAHKLSIRLADRYTHCQLVEINSHSLFSKWFSESGKMVAKMFEKIQELVKDERGLTFLLIDEVESLTGARDRASAGDPSDAVRVVNAVLTQVDKLRQFPNILILTTSNLTKSIDVAFLDRADLRQYIGLPAVPAIYKIYQEALKELMYRDVISPQVSLVKYQDLDRVSSDWGHRLLQLARESEGMSGRTLRKVPFLTYALYIHKTTSVCLDAYLVAMKKAILYKQSEEDVQGSYE